MPRLREYLCVAVLLGISVLALSGCGAGDGAGTAKTTAAAALRKPADATARARLRNCRLRPFLQTLDTLESGLAAGLSYKQYFEEVTKAKSAYESVPIDELELPCLSAVGAPGEKALNQYIEAANAWRECRADVRCGAYAIEPRLQRKWRVASHYIALAQEGQD